MLTGLKYAPSSIFTEAAVEVDQRDAQPTFKVITGKNFTINTVGSFQEIEP